MTFKKMKVKVIYLNKETKGDGIKRSYDSKTELK